MSLPETEATSDLWAVTCYFNPMGYVTRALNYRAFAARLRLPLLAVELGYGDVFELRAGDATRLIQLRTDQVLWHKERLLNIAIEALPASCRKVAWLDCDIMFDREDWVEAAGEALDRHVLVQPYSRVHDLERGADTLEPSQSRSFLVRESMASRYASGTFSADMVTANSVDHYSPGHAWVARREALEGVGLYDAMILGSADNVVALAAVGLADVACRAHGMNAHQTAHYLRWARRFYRRVRGNVGVVTGDLYHLWHGELTDRGYDSRYENLNRFQFDPAKDLVVDDNGSWRWSASRAELHDHVRAYFASRLEDGCPSAPVRRTPDSLPPGSRPIFFFPDLSFRLTLR